MVISEQVWNDAPHPLTGGDSRTKRTHLSRSKNSGFFFHV